MSAGDGLFFMRNRFYDPSVGRFTEPDPSGIPSGQLNLYSYALNSPVGLADPTGLQPSGQKPGATNAGPPPTFSNEEVEHPVPNGLSVLEDYSNMAQVTNTLSYNLDRDAQYGQNIPAGLNVQVTEVIENSTGRSVAIVPSGQCVLYDPNLYHEETDIIEGTGPIVVRKGNQGYTITDPGGYAQNSPFGPLGLAHQTLKDFGPNGFHKVPLPNQGLVLVPASQDPNEITGPAGFGTQGFLQPIGPLPYRIDFTNESSATAPAATVVVTEQLSLSLDLNTFELGEIGFGSTVLQVPAGLTSYSTEVTLPPTAKGAGPDGLIVDISAALNPATGLVTWTFTSLDPTTLDIPINPLEGFLPPDDSEGDGEGFVTYTIEPKSSATTGTVINAQATVVFDTNNPISTAVVSNTIDATVPTSSVKPLPATTSSTSFPVSWSGSDGAGSGIASYNVFFSTNGGPFQPFQTGTTATSATFTGQVGDTYAFYSVATSNVGLVQPTPTAAQATTKVVKATVPPPVIVTSVQWGTIQVKTGSGKKAKTKSETALEITFSAPVAGAGNLGAYELSTVTTKTVKKKPVTTLKPIALGSVVPGSSPRTTSVALVPSRKVNLSQTDELEIIAADITDSQGRALDGKDNGQAGSNFVGTFSRSGLTFPEPSAVASCARLSPAAVDAVLKRVGSLRKAR
jgi:RHS repeat-associated protein